MVTLGDDSETRPAGAAGPKEAFRALPFRSILSDGPQGTPVPAEAEAPIFFADLNLDQVIETVTRGREQYDLKPFFYARLDTVDAITYRHEVLRDLEDEVLLGYVRSFADGMRAMRSHLAQADRLHYRYQKEAWFRDAVEAYCEAVSRLAADMALADIRSRGLLGFREYLTRYIRSDDFRSLLAETKKVEDGLSGVAYCLSIRGSRVQVSRYGSEADYSAEVERTFEKFKRGAVKDHLVDLPNWPDMNHVEAAVLDLVARLHPDVFRALDEYCERRRDYLDRTVADFDREVQFYVACREYVDLVERAGLLFCYPHVSDRSKDVHATGTFDIALANRLVGEGSTVVCNDFRLDHPERILVVTGPNQGGKTTFARTFGQLHYLASIGWPVPGREARLFLADRVFTHFEREEDLDNLSGKLEDDLLRIHEILRRATASSIVIMNESFTSTTLKDALFLGKEVMRRIVDLDLLCVCVTFVDELASLGQTVVSMVSTVDPENPARRTYQVVRRPADGLAYAAAIAEKHGLTYLHLKERMAL